MYRKKKGLPEVEKQIYFRKNKHNIVVCRMRICARRPIISKYNNTYCERYKYIARKNTALE